MRAIITTFVPTEDDQAVTFSLATTGDLPKAERDRLYDLFRSSTVVDVELHGTAPAASRSRPETAASTAERPTDPPPGRYVPAAPLSLADAGSQLSTRPVDQAQAIREGRVATVRGRGGELLVTREELERVRREGLGRRGWWVELGRHVARRRMNGSSSRRFAIGGHVFARRHLPEQPAGATATPGCLRGNGSSSPRGLGNRQIARRIGISHNTVRNHLASIDRKLGVPDRTYAIRERLVEVGRDAAADPRARLLQVIAPPRRWRGG